MYLKHTFGAGFVVVVVVVECCDMFPFAVLSCIDEYGHSTLCLDSIQMKYMIYVYMNILCLGRDCCTEMINMYVYITIRDIALQQTKRSHPTNE